MSGSAIPASQIVSIVPSVLNAGGTGLDLNGLLVMTDNHIPIGQVYSFPNLTAVQSFFGPTSYLAMLAATYFLADINATKRPGALLMTCYYNSQWLPAWLMSAQLPTLTLAQLQAITPNSTFRVTMDGVVHTTLPLSFATATSFSMAAQIIGASLAYYKGPIVSPTVTATGSGTTMTVSALTGANLIQPGDVLNGSWPGGSYVVQQLSGTPGKVGTYQISKAHTQATPVTIALVRNPCTWDAAVARFKIATVPANLEVPANTVPTIGYATPVAGNAATVLGLTQTAGALLQATGNSAAAAGGPFPISTAAAFMDGVVRTTMNWASFATAFDPDVAGSNVQKQAFAAWCNKQQNNYLYVAFDVDPAPTQSANAPASLARILDTSLTSGTAPISSPTLATGRNLAMFTMGVIAAIDFNRYNGRKTLAFRAQTGITPDISNGGVAANLEANKYNYYGIWTTANSLFQFLYPGCVSGPYKWIDSYVNQIWMNNGFQLALMELLTSTGSIPYNQAGYTLIKAACQDVINAALFFGAIRAGVTLSQAQIAEVNNMAGVPIDGILQTQGYYLQVLDASPQVRAARGTPPATFWYMDGGSVQRIALASVMVQ
jgi:Protein of unknown function (DUF3383)